MANYREVKRKACVGERIKIVNAGYAGMPPVYRNGDVLTVINPVIPTTTGVRIDRKWNDGVVDAWVAHSEYVVLEPIAESPVEATPDIRTLLADFLRQNPQASVELRRLLDEVDPQQSAECPDVVAETFARPTGKPPLLRSEVISKARADVAELLRKSRHIYGNPIDFWPGAPGARWIPMQTVDFVVNREKRTVVALIKFLPKYNDGEIYAKGIARCAPDDVFHADIGRAIALRRALGLAVPDEYISAPKPEEPRVGAKVRGNENSWADAGRVGVVTSMRPEGFFDAERGLIAKGLTGNGWAYISRVDVIDDTDVDYSVAYADGVAKEAE